MNSAVEKRDHRRIELRLPLEFQAEAAGRGPVRRTVTRNVSTGGTYFETAIDDLEVGDQLSLAFDVEGQDQRFPPNGRITTVGEVVRVEPVGGEASGSNPAPIKFGVGIKFRQPLKLSF